MPRNYLSDDQLKSIDQIVRGSGMGIDFDLVVQGLANNNWLIHPVYCDGVVAGGILQKGAEIHTSIAPEFQRKWNPRPYINSILYPALEKYGVITSQAEKTDARCLKWLTKLGFSITHEDDDFYYLELTEVKFKPRR